MPPLIGREPDESMAHPPEIPFALQAKDKDNQHKQPEPAADNKAKIALGGSDDRNGRAVMTNQPGPAGAS